MLLSEAHKLLLEMCAQYPSTREGYWLLFGGAPPINILNPVATLYPEINGQYPAIRKLENADFMLGAIDGDVSEVLETWEVKIAGGTSPSLTIPYYLSFDSGATMFSVNPVSKSPILNGAGWQLILRGNSP